MRVATLDALGDFQVDRKQAFLESLAPDDPRREAAAQDLARAVALNAARHQLVAQRTQAERDYRRDVLAATAHCTTADDYRTAAGKVHLAQQELAGRRGELAAAWNFSLATGENRMADDCGWRAAETANRFFDGDTLVKMADGSWRKISELRVGDRVLAVPHEAVGGAATACEVTAIESGMASAWQLTFVNEAGETLQFTASEGHPFYVDGRGWVDVKELKVGDIIVAQNGSTFTLSSKTFVAEVVTWSLTVAEKHTFFVGDGLGNEVLVHNEEEKTKATPKIIWRGNWTDAEKQQILDAIAILQEKIQSLINETWLTQAEMMYSNEEKHAVVARSVGFRIEIFEYESVLRGIKSFLDGECEITFRQQKLSAKTKGDNVQGKYWYGAVYLNTSTKEDWKKLSSIDLAQVIYHEVSHHFGTIDSPDNGVLMNAHDIDKRITSEAPFIKSIAMMNLIHKYYTVTSY